MYSRAGYIASKYNPKVKGYLLTACDSFTALELLCHGDRDCENDHGERTNRKLKDQPFYLRGKTGKMRKW